MKKEDIDTLRGTVEELAGVLKDEELLKALLEAYFTTRADIMPMLGLAKDTVGADIDKIVDETIKWGCKKAFVAYTGYQAAGFSKKEAMQLTLNFKDEFKDSFKNHAKK